MRSRERRELTRGERVARGAKAKEQLESSILNEAFDKIEDDEYEKFLAAGPDEDTLRRACQDRIAAIRDVRQELKSLTTTGIEAALHDPDKP